MLGHRGQIWYWILTSYNGKSLLLGPFDTEAKADAKGAEFGDYKVYPLPTRDDAKASRLVKFQTSKKNRSSVLDRFSRDKGKVKSNESTSNGPAHNGTEPPF